MIQPGLILQNRYEILKEIAQGGFSKIFDINDRNNRGTPKVLKLLNQENFSELETKQKALSLFQREAAVLMRLNHPGIPRVESDGYFTCSEVDKEPFYCLVMDKIEGQNLRAWLEERGNQPITQSQAITWLKQLLDILDYLHQQHYFHRDIKPENIMLKPDGQLVLIDFGSVREVSYTYLAKLGEERDVTVIGSPGYIPLEQNQGRAVPQSDFYALGRTFVYLLTGREPIKFPEDDLTGELIWRNGATQVSSELVELIDQMMSLFPRDRPKLQDIWQGLQSIENELPITELNPQKIGQKFGQTNLRQLLKAITTSLAITALVIGVRQMGLLEKIEWQAFDHLMSLRAAEQPDPRILVIEATEKDIKDYGYPLPDGILAQLIEKIQYYQPRVIGLNIFRDRAVGNNPTTLAFHWQYNNRLIGSCQVKTSNEPNQLDIAPPDGIPNDRLGFGNVVVDADGVLRRHLLFMPLVENSPCATQFSTSFQLAYHYLKAERIEPENQKNELHWGKAIFKYLHSNPGGYRRDDLGGHQVLLNYRASMPVAQTMTLAQFLKEQVNPNWVKDRIVIIGMNSEILGKITTPETANQSEEQNLPRVMIQAQMVSQILSAVLDGRPLLHPLSQWAEVLWIGGWSIVGGVLAEYRRSLLHLGWAGSFAIVTLYGSCFILLTKGIWLPLVPSALALIGAGGSAIATTPWKSQQKH